MDCGRCGQPLTLTNLLSALAAEREGLARTLRNEAAQTLALVLLGLTMLERLDTVAEIREETQALHGAIVPELERIVDLASSIEQRNRSSCPFSACPIDDEQA